MQLPEGSFLDSLPGSGISYVTTSNINKRAPESNARQNNNFQTTNYNTQTNDNTAIHHENHNQSEMSEQQPVSYKNKEINRDAIKSIHKTSDEPVDWTEVLVNPVPTEGAYNAELWAYYHSVAQNIIDGDIDTYLKVIYEVNPLNDLLEYGGGYEFGTDNPRIIEVEFTVKSNGVMPSKSSLGASAYLDLLQDYVCSCSIRVARDMLALLPVKNVIVNAVDMGNTILSVNFDRATMYGIKFGFINPSELIVKFKHNMIFDLTNGFSPVKQITE